LPIFALTNADVSLAGLSVEALFASPVLLGVACGLVLGKPTGVMLASLLVVKLKLAKLPEGVNWLQMFGASVLAGVGFTMAIFVANLAFTSDAVITVAKAGILLASIVAGTAGFIVLRFATRPNEEAPASIDD
jgi:NhaA family Na+:H+ antiporter